MKSLSSEDLLAYAVRFRFGEYEVSRCKSWWEVWGRNEGHYIRHPNGTYNFTQEEAIETARRLDEEDK